jgi:hypothetical protein
MVFIVLDILMLPVSKDCPRLITLSVISILHLFRLSSFCVLCSILHVFLNWLFLIVPSGFSTVQQYGRYLHLHLLGTEHCLCRPLRSGKTIALRWRKRVILICLHYIIIRLFYLNWLLLIILSGRCSRFSSIRCYLIMLCQLSITCLSLTINMAWVQMTKLYFTRVCPFVVVLLAIHCIVCTSSVYGFWSFHWCIHTLLINEGDCLSDQIDMIQSIRCVLYVSCVNWLIEIQYLI